MSIHDKLPFNRIAYERVCIFGKQRILA